MTLSKAVRPLVMAAMIALLASPSFAFAEDPAQEANTKLGRGINLGNALEAPSEGEWGMTLEESFFEEIKDAGFDSVRIPIRWSNHADREAPYAVDPEFFERVDWAIDQATSRGLVTVVNFHHIEEIYEDPSGEKARFLKLWEQVADRYKDQPGSVYFEILNEPHGNLDADSWNEMLGEALGIIRGSNPDRTVIIGPASWNNYRGLDTLNLPEDDRNIIATFHYYDPFRFTHQGAEWVDDSEPWLGTTWDATDAQKKDVTDAFDSVVEWASANNRPIYMGEFGAYSKADRESRSRWTTFITREAERRGFSWAYWEFGSGFGAFDRKSGAWRPELKNALVPSGAGG